MFTRIAPCYDRINRLISLGLDRFWRRVLVRGLPPGLTPRRVLDLCCGTGELLILLAKRFPAADLTGVDFAAGMLRLAAMKLARQGGGKRLELLEADQNALPLPDAGYDLVTNAFGLRNSIDLDRSIAEARRVLTPGGILAVLELTRPGDTPFGRLFSFYFNKIAPRIAAVCGGDPAAYSYLPASVGGFLTDRELVGRIGTAMGAPVRVICLWGRVVTLAYARKPLDG